MVNIIQDISTLTTIQEKYINRLVGFGIYAICDAIEEDIKEGKYVTDVDIGIGTLAIGSDDNELKFKFIPSAKLKEGVIDTVKNKKNILEHLVATGLVNKLTDTYKDIL